MAVVERASLPGVLAEDAAGRGAECWKSAFAMAHRRRTRCAAGGVLEERRAGATSRGDAAGGGLPGAGFAMRGLMDEHPGGAV